jgi:hypothetical protein
MNEFTQGLTLSGIGILITFSSLGILILLILALKALFPERISEADRESQPLDPDQDRERLKETAAAVGVATLMKTKGFGKGSLGSLLEKPVGKWWAVNQDRIRGKE